MAYYKTNKGILLEEYDETVNPRKDMDHFTIFLTFCKGYCSPDNNKFKSYDEMVIHFAGEKADSIYRKEGIGAGNDYLVKQMEKKGYIAIPVYKFEHSGISYQASMRNPYHCPFDSCLIGIIYASKNDIKKEYSVKKVTNKLKEKVLQIMRDEVEYYSAWANGEVYYYQLLDENNEEIDACGGFIGDLDKNGALDMFDIKEYEYIGENL